MTDALEDARAALEATRYGVDARTLIQLRAALSALIAEHERLTAALEGFEQSRLAGEQKLARVQAEVTRPLGNWDRPTVEDSVLAILDAEEEVSRIEQIADRLTAPPSDDEREALIAAINVELAWDWYANLPEHIPSSHDVLGDIADAVAAAGFRRPGPITDEQVEAAALRLYGFEYPGSRTLPNDWEGAMFRRRARAALEAAREA